MNSKKIKICQAITQAIAEEMTSNKRIFVIGEEVGKSNGTYNCTNNLLDKFGSKRVIDTPISEMGFTGLAVGASFAGLIPICEFMTWNFALQSIDHVVNSAAKMRYMSGGQIGSHIVFRGPNGFAKGVGAQHTQDFSAWYGSVPGLHVCAPYSARDHRGILKKALRDGNPVVILENEMLYEKEFPQDESFEDQDYVQDFKCVIEKTGKDVTIVGISLSLVNCLAAGEELIKHKIADAEIINLVSIRPLDIDTIIDSVRKTKKLVIVDNAWPMFGISSEIVSLVYEKLNDILKLKIAKIYGKDCPTAYSQDLEEMSFPLVYDIVEAVKNIMK